MVYTSASKIELKEIFNLSGGGMRFIVFGSMVYDGCPTDKLSSAARSLGAVIASRGHAVIVGTDNPRTVDLYVVEGVNSIKGLHEVVVDRPESTSKPGHESSTREYPFMDPLRFANVKFRHRLREPFWGVAHFQAMAEADCVIVLGGAHGTSLAGLSASALRKPVVAIPAFGGAAKQVWLEVSQYYKAAGISDEQKSALSIWQNESADVAITMAETLTRRNPLKESGRPLLIACLCSLVLLSGLWFAMFLEVLGPLKSWKVAVMLGISALLGNGLRALLNLQRMTAERIDGVRVATELVSSLIVSLALVIFYFLGGIAYLGKPTLLNDPDPSKLSNAALFVSLIGLASGFLLEKAVAAMEKALEPVVSASLSNRRS